MTDDREPPDRRPEPPSTEPATGPFALFHALVWGILRALLEAFGAVFGWKRPPVERDDREED